MNRTRFVMCAFLASILLFPVMGNQALAVTSPSQVENDHNKTAVPVHRKNQVLILEKTLRSVEKQLGQGKIARKAMKTLRASLKRFSIQTPTQNWSVNYRQPDPSLWELRWQIDTR